MKKFDSLTEQEILALAISLEEEDERVYADFAEGLRDSFPATAAVFDAILHKTPTAPVRLNSEIPVELEHIITRALEKDRNLRYQHASDMRAEFQRLKRDTDSVRSVSMTAAGEASEPTTSLPVGAKPSRGKQKAATLASQRSVTEAPRKLPWKIMVPAAVLVAFGAIAAIGSRRRRAAETRRYLALIQAEQTVIALAPAPGPGPALVPGPALAAGG